MDNTAPLRSAAARIRKHRTAAAKLTLVAADGRPLAGFEGRVRLVRHEFKLGANAFLIGGIEDKGLQREYEDRFAALMNYATLPFYWGGYEKEMDHPQADHLRNMAAWCARRGIIAKGHPLVWHEVFPEWAKALADAEVLRRLEERVKTIVSQFRGSIDIWDVVNEATVSERFDNAVGRWIKARGAAECVKIALGWAREAAPSATLLYNDFNISPAFEALVKSLIDSGAPANAVGVQSHMHKERWTLEKAWDACDAYGRFGLPVHFTELTVLSGRPKAAEDNDWHLVHTDWHTTKKGEAAQLSYGKRFYTLLFSHPAVEAITWWDMSDLRSWQGAPAGLVRADMTPKPLYDWLLASFGPGGKWHTDVPVVADARGRAKARCFFGDYEVTGRTASGHELQGRFTLGRRGAREVLVVMK
jgi:endo-1,4-beta-xylanase